MTRHTYHFVVLATALFFGTVPAWAQTTGLTANSKAPLEISADGTLEWLRNDKTFVARQNALAVQGDSSVAAQTLSAQYREGKDSSGMEIYKVTAENGVVLKSRDSTAYGQKAVYNLDDGLAIMTGDNLKLVSPDQTVTARDKFEYWTTDGRFNALGDAVVVRPKPDGAGSDTLKADKISAVMKENEHGERALYTLEATGNVVITTPTDVVTGAYGIYRAATNKAELTGGVKIIRGPNTLEGERAEVDMNTNISTIFGDTNKPTGRVRGVFYPGSQDSP